MQDVSSLQEDTNRNSKAFQTDYERQSKLTTSKTEEQKNLSRLPAVRVDPTVSLKTTSRSQKLKGYEPPVSARESWWRTTIKDTPNPGTYDTHLNTFIKEIMGRQMTYGFKSDGRRRDPQPLEPKGKELLPGAYRVEDFIERMNRLRLSYGFKGPERDDLLKESMLTNQDRNIDVPPGSYETQKYQTINAPVGAVKHSFFKSKTRRKVFLPKLGPAPSDYEPQLNITNTKSPTIVSSFRSRTDRFNTKSFNVPGPGTYDQLTEFPKLKQIGTYASRGVFFNASFSPMASTTV